MRRLLIGITLLLAVAGLAPSPAPAMAQTDGGSLDARADEIFAQMSAEQRVGQLFLVTYYGPDSKPTSQIASLIAEYHVGGVVLSTVNENFTDNGTVAEQIPLVSAELQTIAANKSLTTDGSGATPEAGPYVPLFIGIQQDGISSTKSPLLTGFSPLPSSMSVGATWDPDLAEKSGQVVGEELNGMGINLLLGTSADVVENPQMNTQGDLGVSVFGGEPFWVSRMVESYVQGVHEGSDRRVAVIVGHFPGHGGADRLATVEVPIVRKSLDQLTQFDLLPFFAITGDATNVFSTTDGILTGHISYRGFQGDNPRVATRPISLDSQALQVLLKLDPIARWRSQGGLVVSDSLGLRGIKRFYDPQETTFNNRRIAMDALLAGNDVLYLDQFGSNPPENQGTTIEDTIDFFVQAYEADPAFQARVNDAVHRIIRKKLEIYNEFDLERTVLPPERSRAMIGQHADIAFNVAQSAVTLLSPSKPDLLTSPQARNRIVIFTDTRPLRLCNGCQARPTIAVDALQSAILKFYGPQASAQVQLESVQSFTFEQLWNFLQHGPATSTGDDATPPPDSLEIALVNADWVVFVMQNVDPEVPSSDAVKQFLAAPSVAPTAQIVVMATKAPYYLDSTEVGRLAAYYGIYGGSAPFIDVAARALFLGVPMNGSSPVSVSGTNYNIAEATSPDPAQVIKLRLKAEEGEQTGTILAPVVGGTLNIETSVILDRNGRPVSDGTPVDFIFSNSDGSRTSSSASTLAGIATISYTLSNAGRIDVTVQSGLARQSETLQITGTDVTVLPPNPSPTPAEGGSMTPVGPTPTATEDTEGETTPWKVDFGDWFVSLLGLTGICASVFWYGQKSRDMNQGLLMSLPTLVFGLAGYNYFALHFPGAAEWHKLLGGSIWAAGFATWLTGLIGLALTIIVLGGKIPWPRPLGGRRNRRG